MEIWRDIPGYEGKYQVSDHGRVRSMSRRAPIMGGHTREVPGKILKPGTMTKYGHQSVMLGREGGSKCVHALVLLAFVGPPPVGQEGRHLNTVTTNNRLDNLAYGTKSQNGKDFTRAGKRRVTYEQAEDIRRRYAAGESGVALANEYNMSRSNVGWITSGKYYS